MCATFGKGHFTKLVPVASLIQVLVLVRVSYRILFRERMRFCMTLQKFVVIAVSVATFVYAIYVCTKINALLNLIENDSYRSSFHGMQCCLQNKHLYSTPRK